MGERGRVCGVGIRKKRERGNSSWILYERRIKKNLKNPYPYVTSNTYGGHLFFPQLLSTWWLLSANEKRLA